MGAGSILGIFLGLILGVGVAMMVTVNVIKKSNDIGDSKGSLRDFGTYVNMHAVEDNLPRYRPSDRGKILLENLKREALGEVNTNRNK